MYQMIKNQIKISKTYFKTQFRNFKTSKRMYTFQQQQKIFKDLLTNNPSNKQCADCNTIGPTWASLNFGVFLCSNCSGAHRALGPTITRVKSTKLDQWQKEWMECMQIGNKEINEYWEADLGIAKKPKMGAAQPELIKYASEKYVKKRYVKAPSEEDPLTKYKKGTYVKSQVKEETQQIEIKPVAKSQPQVPKILKPVEARSNVAVQNESKNLNLIEFEFAEFPKLQVQSQTQEIDRSNGHHLQMPHFSPPIQILRKTSQNYVPAQQEDDDQFSEFTEYGTSFTGTTNDNALTYEDLISRKSNDSGNSHYNIPPTLHHTQSASSIPHHHSPPFNMSMNGHTHHVGGHHNQTNGHYFNVLNFKQLYNQSPQQNPYQSVGYLPVQHNVYQQPQYNSLYTGHNNNLIQTNQNSLGLMGQNFSLNQQTSIQYNQNLPNNNTSNLGFMSNQQNLNPSNMPLGGYHNQGYGSHSVQGTANQGQKQEEFHWNDFSGWQGLGKHHQPHHQQQPSPQQQQGQSGQSTKSWVDDWK